MEVETMLGYEKGEVGPETKRTIARIEREWREKIGLDPDPNEKSVLHDWATLRERWASDPDR